MAYIEAKFVLWYIWSKLCLNKFFQTVATQHFYFAEQHYQVKIQILINKFETQSPNLFVCHCLHSSLCFQYKLCRVRKVQTGPKGIPFLVTHDGRTIRYPDPLIKVNDSILLDLASMKIKEFIKFDSGKAYI